MKEDERAASKAARTLLTKHGLDISRAQVSVIHGICYIRGIITAMPGYRITDTQAEVERIGQFIRQKPGVRSVVVECSAR